MKRIYRAILICIFVLTAIIPSALAQGDSPQEPPGRDPAFEQEIYDRLAVINPDTVSIFQKATQAMDADDLTTAKREYEKVLDLAPDFPDAARRLSYVELRLGNVDAAVERARQALAAQDSAYNHTAMVDPLLATENSENEREALSHARAAVEELPDDDHANVALLFAGLVNKDMDAIRQASTTLVRVLPEFPYAHYFFGLLAANDGKWELAERELLLAQELGMPAEDVQSALDDGIASQARQGRWLRRGAYILVGWLVGMGVLFLVGMGLSRLTLTAVQRTRLDAQFEVGRGEQIVRTVYRIVIALTSVYFYISIPLVILIVVAAAAGVFYRNAAKSTWGRTE
ncbi:MAG: hypothetical protein GY832_10535 [Chloroflexi bacterium]|nr:hypothetical protein [Chloroflexota bacterium]